jgi:rhodanese-related sulfurtransferase
MRYRRLAIVLMLLSSCLLTVSAQRRANHALSVEFISATELKDKLARNERVTIIDVRATSSYAESTDKIKGAIHVKLRRLRSRLQVPPFKSIPRDSEVVTYCACEDDEASVRAAQILIDAGFTRVRALKGGWEMWRKIKGPVEQRPRA